MQNVLDDMTKMNEYDYNKMLEELELNDAREKSKRQRVIKIIKKLIKILLKKIQIIITKNIQPKTFKINKNK